MLCIITVRYQWFYSVAKLCSYILLLNHIIYYQTYYTEAAILRLGNPLKWPQAKPHLNFVRKSGYNQFRIHYLRCKDIQTPLFLWGDEIEYGLFKKDSNLQHYDLYMNGTELRQFLNNEEIKYSDLPIGCEWQPEYGSWMIEAVPRNPYGSYIADLLNVEKSLQLRRKRLHNALKPDVIAPSISTFPMLGVEGYKHSLDARGELSQSLYLSDEVINPHPRFGALTQNIRLRRQRNVNITVSKDTDEMQAHLPSDHPTNDSVGDATSVHMDAMAFGMGCCCIQVTMQCKSEFESRYLHDQLAILSPIFQALSASTPILKGALVDTDTRWEVISKAVDDRTPAEEGLIHDDSSSLDPDLVGGGVKKLSKSRYSSVSRLIGKPHNAEELKALQALNDLGEDSNLDREAYESLLQDGLDPLLAAHIAHLFVRDPLVIFDDAIYLDDANTLDHFENIQSTNWRSIRWKLPALKVGLEYDRRVNATQLHPRPHHEAATDSQLDEVVNDFDDLLNDLDGFENDPSTDPYNNGSPNGSSWASAATKRIQLTQDLQSFGPGWRVEFRPLEVQLTDFENAAYAILVVLISRCLLALLPTHQNLYMPMSYIEENMRRAQRKDAVLQQRFWISRSALRPHGDGFNLTDGIVPLVEEIDLVELTIAEIMNGEVVPKGSDLIPFPGVIPTIIQYLQSLGCTASHWVFADIVPYLFLLSQRAAGKLPTTAHWMRQYVISHPAYQGQANVSPEVVDDLLKLCDDIGMGRVPCSGLYGNIARGRKQTSMSELDISSASPLEGSATATTLPTRIPLLDNLDDEDLIYVDFRGDTCDLDALESLMTSSSPREVEVEASPRIKDETSVWKTNSQRVPAMEMTNINRITVPSPSPSLMAEGGTYPPPMTSDEDSSSFSFVSKPIRELLKNFKKSIRMKDE